MANTESGMIFGTPAHKITRRDAPDTSRDAGRKVLSANDEQRVYQLLTDRPMTSKEVAAAMEKPLNAVSGRLSALQQKFLIRDTGIRRDGARVMGVVEGQASF